MNRKLTHAVFLRSCSYLEAGRDVALTEAIPEYHFAQCVEKNHKTMQQFSDALGPQWGALKEVMWGHYWTLFAHQLQLLRNLGLISPINKSGSESDKQDLHDSSWPRDCIDDQRIFFKLNLKPEQSPVPIISEAMCTQFWWLRFIPAIQGAIGDLNRDEMERDDNNPTSASLGITAYSSNEKFIAVVGT